MTTIICPYRVNIEFEYALVETTEGENMMQVASQNEVFPRCVGDKCPFYTYPDTCRKAEIEIES